MEEYLCRAMEVARLTDIELERLQEHEKRERVLSVYMGEPMKIRKILRPFEIQMALKLCTLKEQYGIPESDDSSQAEHNKRLRKELKDLNLTPKHGDFSVMDVIQIHPWDWKVREAVKAGKISFYYQSGGMGKKRLAVQYED